MQAEDGADTSPLLAITTAPLVWGVQSQSLCRRAIRELAPALGGPRREPALVIKFSAEGVYGELPVEFLKYLD
ncbi:MAG TPA: hypothetical protein VK497_02635 [Candidatus Saccharimonadales bacterium]|nr:hypothetical protein [Candidatus Saccharimonadales bacterium]